MATDQPIGESAATIFTAAALLVRNAKPGDEAWRVAAALHDAFSRLDREIALLRDQLDRRAVAVPPEPAPRSERRTVPRTVPTLGAADDAASGRA
jgi:hypothetical protein